MAFFQKEMHVPNLHFGYPALSFQGCKATDQISNCLENKLILIPSTLPIKPACPLPEKFGFNKPWSLGQISSGGVNKIHWYLVVLKIRDVKGEI